MAIITKGILGGFSGKLGPAVGFRWKKQDVIRANSEKSDKPPTIKQIANRAKFKLARFFAGQLEHLLRFGLQSRSHKLMPSERFVQHFMLYAITGSYPDFKIDYGQVMLSKGILNTGTVKREMVLQDGLLTVSWGEPNELNADDVAKLVLYEESSRQFYYGNLQTERSALKVSWPISNAFNGDKLVGWLFFVAADGLSASRTVYLGEIDLLQAVLTPGNTEKNETARD